jgi:anti-anti-sigma factor
VQIRTEVVEDLGVIRVNGEIDLADADQLSRTADRMLEQGAHSLVIDCAEVDFMDSRGIRALVLAHQHAHQQGGTVTVHRPSPFIHNLLQITGLAGVLIVDPPRPRD